MFRSMLCLCAVLLTTALPACQSDARTSKALVGNWSWNPRDVLPPEQIVEKGFPTPDLEAFHFGADGSYVATEHIPGWETTVVGKPFQVPEQWVERKGRWVVERGELRLEGAADADRWGASRDAEKGWVSENVAAEGGRWFKVLDVTSNRVQLKDLAIGGYDRRLQRATAMPQRPTLGSKKP